MKREDFKNIVSDIASKIEYLLDDGMDFNRAKEQILAELEGDMSFEDMEKISQVLEMSRGQIEHIKSRTDYEGAEYVGKSSAYKGDPNDLSVEGNSLGVGDVQNFIDDLDDDFDR